MVEASERFSEAGRFAGHAVLVEATHQAPREHFSVGKLLEEPSFLEEVQYDVLIGSQIYNLTNDRAKNTKANRILLSLESTKRLRAETAPATAALSLSFFENRRNRHRTPLYRELSRLTNSANFNESRWPLSFNLNTVKPRDTYKL